MFKLSRICSSPIKNGKGEYNIFLMGYNDGKYTERTTKFRDYFYITDDFSDEECMEYNFYPDRNVKYKTMDGKDCYKTFYKNFYDIYKARDNVDIKYEIYSSDIKPEQKYLLDNNIEWDVEDRNICFYDIETDVDLRDNDANKPHRAEKPITSIQLYIQSRKTYYTMSWHPELTKHIDDIKVEEEDDKVYIYCNNEKIMLNFFIMLLNDEKVDCLVGWYSEQYDLPYIINRSRRLDIPIESISPIGNIYCSNEEFSSRNVAEVVEESDNSDDATEKKGSPYKNKWTNYIHGLDHVDMMDMLKNMNIHLSNDKLETAAKEILNDDENEHIRKIKNVTWKDWLGNYEGFIKYGIRDVEILVEIDKKRKILNTFTTLQNITNIPRLKEFNSKTATVENMLFKLFWNDKIVFPNRHFYIKKEYKGAFVLDPLDPGLHKNVAILDYASLYPTTIMWANLSNETFITSYDIALKKGLDIDKDIIPDLINRGIKFVDTGYDEELVGKRYLYYAQQSKPGLFAQLERYMYTQRLSAKDKMKKCGKDSIEYQILDTRQYIYKIVLNSAYGAFGSPTYRFYKPEIADTITFFSRKSILLARDYFKSKFDMDTLYIDTDSLFLSLKEYSDGFLEKETKLFTDEHLMKEIILKHNNGFNQEYMFMDLEHEKTLERIYFGNVKKRYYAIQNNGKKYIRGINIIRKDTPMFMRGALGELVENAVMERLNLSDIERISDDLKKADLKDIGVYKRFTKRFEDYPSGTQHVRSTLWANELFNCNITQKDVVLQLYIKNKCEDHLKAKERHNVICLPEDDVNLILEHSNLMEIDYQMYMDKQIIQQLEEFALIDLVKFVIEQYKLKHPDFYPPKAPKDKCPVCEKTHSKSSLAIACALKVRKKIDKKKDTNDDELKILASILSKSMKYIKLFPEGV